MLVFPLPQRHEAGPHLLCPCHRAAHAEAAPPIHQVPPCRPQHGRTCLPHRPDRSRRRRGRKLNPPLCQYLDPVGRTSGSRVGHPPSEKARSLLAGRGPRQQFSSAYLCHASPGRYHPRLHLRVYQRRPLLPQGRERRRCHRHQRDGSPHHEGYPFLPPPHARSCGDPSSNPRSCYASKQPWADRAIRNCGAASH